MSIISLKEVINQSEDEIYVCGGIYGSEGSPDTFQLVTPSSEDLPYLTKRADSRAMRGCGHHSALYRIGKSGKALVKVSNPNYELNKVEPQMVMLTEEQQNIIALAIKARRTFVS